MAIWTAFAAGLLSVASPCVLPLVPVYAAYLAGGSPGRSGSAALAGRGALFILGFGLVFVGLGATATEVGRLLAGHVLLLERLSAALIVAFGLVLLGVLPAGALARTVRFVPAAPGRGPLGPFVLGLAFAAGWTPCVGPILATILLLAASAPTAWQGMGLLAAYALGMGIPFLALAAVAGPLVARLRGSSAFLLWSERLAGVLLLAVGTAMGLGLYGRLAGLSL